METLKLNLKVLKRLIDKCSKKTRNTYKGFRIVREEIHINSDDISGNSFYIFQLITNRKEYKEIYFHYEVRNPSQVKLKKSGII